MLNYYVPQKHNFAAHGPFLAFMLNTTEFHYI